MIINEDFLGLNFNFSYLKTLNFNLFNPWNFPSYHIRCFVSNPILFCCLYIFYIFLYFRSDFGFIMSFLQLKKSIWKYTQSAFSQVYLILKAFHIFLRHDIFVPKSFFIVVEIPFMAKHKSGEMLEKCQQMRVISQFFYSYVYAEWWA